MAGRSIVLVRLLILIVALAASPGAATAQGRTWAGAGLKPMLDRALWRLGALRINASLSLANAGYDTDVYYGYFGESVPDFTLSASIPVQVLCPLGDRAVLELNDSPQYLFYGRTEKERAWNNIFGGGLHIALERLYIHLGGGLENVRQRLSPELDINVRTKADRLNGTLLWQAAEKVSLAALYGYARYDYGEAGLGGYDLSGTQNREERTVDLVTYLQPTARARLFLDGQYAVSIFAEPGSGHRDTRSYGIFGGLSFVKREDEAGPVDPPQGSISLGYKRFDVLDASLSDGWGFVGAVNVSMGIIAKTSVTAFLSRDFVFSVYSDEVFLLSTAFGGGVSRRLSRRSTVSYNATFGRSDYPEGVGSPEDRDYRFTNHLITVNARMARHLTVTFQASLSRRAIGAGGSARNRHFLGLSLVYGFPAGSISAPIRGLSR